ncbi:MAG: tyrosine-type recombinase/integrase [Bdellovibrionota bacterium]
MKIKFDPNKYKGYQTATDVPGSPNIRRIYRWNKEKQRYLDPANGKKYEGRLTSKAVGKRATKTFFSLAEARDWLYGTATQKQQAQSSESYNVSDLLSDWKRLGWAHLSKSTQIYYSRMFKSFEPIYNIQVESLHPQHIDEWLHTLRSPVWLSKFSSKRESLDKEYTLLKSAVTWYIDRNDNTKLTSPFKKRHSQMVRIRPAKAKTRKAMYPEELELWLSELKKDNFLYYVMALVQVHQVLRVSEVAAMRWSNLNLEHREYTVAEHVIWPRINGAPPELLPGTKTNKSGEVFKSFLQQESVVCLSEIRNVAYKSDLIFTVDGSLLTYRQIQHAYDKAFVKLGLPFRGTHVCRHSGATHFLEKTGDMLALQQMGAWRTQQMAMHYGKISASRAKEATLKAEKSREHLRLVRDEKSS